MSKPTAYYRTIDGSVPSQFTIIVHFLYGIGQYTLAAICILKIMGLL